VTLLLKRGLIIQQAELVPNGAYPNSSFRKTQTVQLPSVGLQCSLIPGIEHSAQRLCEPAQLQCEARLRRAASQQTGCGSANIEDGSPPGIMRYW